MVLRCLKAEKTAFYILDTQNSKFLAEKQTFFDFFVKKLLKDESIPRFPAREVPSGDKKAGRIPVRVHVGPTKNLS